MEKYIISISTGLADLRLFYAQATGQDATNLSEDQLLDFTQQALLDAGIIGKPVRHYQGTSYYFDESGRYCSDRTSSRFPDLIYRNKNGQRRARLWDMGYATKTTAHNAALNAHLWIKAVSTFTEGDTLRQCLKKYSDTELRRYQTDLSYVESMVTSITSSVERSPNNPKKNTFDRIRVTVGLSSIMFASFQDLRQAVIANKQEIHRMVLDHIAESRKFQVYGLPVNILALSSLNLWRDHTLEYIFEPKQLTLDQKISSASSRMSAGSSMKPRSNEKQERKEHAHE